MRSAMVQAKTSGEQVGECVKLSTFLANRQINQEQHPQRWQLAYNSLLDGILSYYATEVSNG